MASDKFPALLWVPESPSDLTDALDIISTFEKCWEYRLLELKNALFLTSFIWEATKCVSGLHKTQFSEINSYPQVMHLDLQA